MGRRETYRVKVEPGGRLLLGRAEFALTAWRRFRGLMLRGPLAPDEGLLIARCGSVHTFFMRFPIDLVYLDQGRAILKIAHAVKPWRLSACWKADSVLEMTAGRAREAGLAVGDRLVFEEARVGL
jgi:uncharacterized membrane protein (UPF0127 family)